MKQIQIEKDFELLGDKPHYSLTGLTDKDLQRLLTMIYPIDFSANQPHKIGEFAEKLRDLLCEKNVTYFPDVDTFNIDSFIRFERQEA